MDIPCDVCLEPHELFTWYEKEILDMDGCPTCKGVRPSGMTSDDLHRCESIKEILQLNGDDLDASACFLEDFGLV